MSRELGIERCIRAHGGLARTRELIAADYYTELIRVFATYGVIVDAGHGWWATREVSTDVLAARRLGGRLACASALAHHGAIPRPGISLHVLVDKSSRRPRRAHTIVHWSRLTLGGDRQAVDLATAWRQARHCSDASATLEA